VRRSIPFLVLLLGGTASCGGGSPRSGDAPPPPAAPRTSFQSDAAPAPQEAFAPATGTQGRAAGGPNINPTAAPGVAFNYRYSFALAAPRVVELQEAHAAMCERLTPARCRITGMHYQVIGPDDIQARLELKLDPAVARHFGRAASGAVLQAGGMLTENEISGVDAGSQIRQTGTDITRLQADLARIEQQLRASNDAEERLELQNQAQRLRDQIRGLGDQRQAQEETLATTPMVLNYGSGNLVPGYQPPQSIGEALGNAGEDFMAGAKVLLVALIRAGPFLILLLAIGLVALFVRRRWFPRAPAATPEPEAEPAEA
jgi:Domain of unknown function (DUF4349)